MKLRTQFFSLNSHISSALKPHVAGGYHIGQPRFSQLIFDASQGPFTFIVSRIRMEGGLIKEGCQSESRALGGSRGLCWEQWGIMVVKGKKD